MRKKTLRLLLGDQLNARHSWFKKKDENYTYLMMEMRQETDYAKHHIQKIIAFFLAMRHFAQALTDAGHHCIYLSLDDEENEQDLTKNIGKILKQGNYERLEYQLPDEYRLDQQLKRFCQSLHIENLAVDTEHFLSTRNELADFFKNRKSYLMESYYRHMRKKHRVLMDKNKEPLGGQWNYDQENRKSFKKEVKVPKSIVFQEDVLAIKKMVELAGISYIGELDEQQFYWPTSRKQSLLVLRDFIEQKLPYFGKYQDAMTEGEAFLFHSMLSFALNTKMIHPKEVVEAVEQAYHQSPESYPIAAVEGFVRQIIGWREYMRGVYWAKMPEYASYNFFGFENKLPSFYWTAKTKMNCMKQAIGQSLAHAYAHHIQRLMITGNFALLAMVHPDEVDAWYLGIYIDAIEWVEITNTRGMSQFADGGLVGSKPYVSSANYIDKMSDYCSSCYYQKRKNMEIGPALTIACIGIFMLPTGTN